MIDPTNPHRRELKRREEDRPRPMYLTGTVLCSWLGIVTSALALVWVPIACAEPNPFMATTLVSSFATFLFRLTERHPIG